MEDQLSINNQFNPYESSLRLKNVGFDEECLYYYDKQGMLEKFAYYDFFRTNSEIQSEFGGEDKCCTAPLWQQAFDWFRIKKQLNVSLKLVTVDSLEGKKTLYSATIHIPGNESIALRIMNYEEMRRECLKKLIEIVENKENG